MKRQFATAIALLALITPVPGSARGVIPPTVVGPPEILANGRCLVSAAEPDGAGPGTAILFRALMLGAPVERTTTSFITGGSGTANAEIAAQRKAAGLPYEPQTFDTAGAAPPAVFTAEGNGPIGWAPYQRLPLTASERVAEPFGLIFATATSPARGRIAALVLSLATRPTARPRLRLTIGGLPDRGCRQQEIRVYSPATSAGTLSRLSMPGGKCHWVDLFRCPRAQWPHGRVLFVSPSYGATFEYRWIDYDLLADWHFARTRS